VPSRFQVFPLDHHLEILVFLDGADNPNWLAGAFRMALVPGPSLRIAVDLGKISAGERSPSGTIPIDKGLGEVHCLLGLSGGDDPREENQRGNNKKEKGVVVSHGEKARSSGSRIQGYSPDTHRKVSGSVRAPMVYNPESERGLPAKRK